MADGDRPVVLVPLATARRAARRAGVTLNLSAEDIALAGKWKHGWIPLDAVASAVKAKRYHGGGGEGHTVKGKGRAGSAVESRREPSRGRTKVKVGSPERASGPRRESHISAESMKDGRHKLTDSKTGESVKAVHLASFHNQGHTITGVRNGQMHTRDDSGKAHVYDPATGRAARSAATERVQQVAQDRTRRLEAARGKPKLAELSEADLQSLISRYGEKSVQADAARAEMLRRGAPGRGASKRSKPLNLPSGYEVRPDRVHVAPGVTQLGSTFSAYGPDGRRVHHAARSESEAARMARKHHERATESERRHQEAAAARSAAAQVKQGEQAAWDARMAAGTARHKVTTDAIAERRKAEPVLLRIRAGMLSKDDLTALADDPSAGRYERVAAHRALTALASRRLATATPVQLDQIESVATSAKGLAPSERAAFMRAAAARRRKLKREGK